MHCDFQKGNVDYLDTDRSVIETSLLAGGGTLAKIHVAHESGSWFRNGEAFQSESGIELTYYLVNQGEIAFELYGCSLEFHLKDITFNPETNFTINSIYIDEEPSIES